MHSSLLAINLLLLFLFVNSKLFSSSLVTPRGAELGISRYSLTFKKTHLRIFRFLIETKTHRKIDKTEQLNQRKPVHYNKNQTIKKYLTSSSECYLKRTK